MRIAKRSLAWSIVLSVLMIGAGLVAIIIPIVLGVAAAELMGCLLIFSGLVHVLFGRHALGQGGGFIWELLLGVVYGAAGFYLLLRHAVSITVLTVGLATYLNAEAGLESVQCWRLRQLRGVRCNCHWGIDRHQHDLQRYLTSDACSCGTRVGSLPGLE